MLMLSKYLIDFSFKRFCYNHQHFQKFLWESRNSISHVEYFNSMKRKMRLKEDIFITFYQNISKHDIEINLVTLKF